jgi:hypothetical protein
MLIFPMSHGVVFHGGMLALMLQDGVVQTLSMLPIILVELEERQTRQARVVNAIPQNQLSQQSLLTNFSHHNTPLCLHNIL